MLHTLLFRGWGVLAGGISILMIPICLSPTQQGFYYTFASLLALQVFFELGLNQVIIQLVSHEAAHLTIQEDGKVSGDLAHTYRFSGLIQLMRRWYAFAAVLFVVLTGSAGWMFFVLNGGDQAVDQWGPIWLSLVFLTAINLFLSHRLAIIEGTGHVGDVARLRLLQSMVGYSVMWTLLIIGMGLWTALAVPTVSALVTAIGLRRWNCILRQPPAVEGLGLEPISWRRDVLPLQWRTAITWACGYIIFSLFTPTVFATHGAVEAGRLGMAITVFNAITTMGLSWINAKTPNFTMHISRNEFQGLNRLFKAMAMRSIVATALPSYLMVMLVALGTHYHIDELERIASLNTLFWIACAATGNTTVNVAAVYMRAHREEPMLPIAVVSAALTLAVVTLLRNDVTNMMIGYAVISICVTLPWTIRKFNKYHHKSVD